jgi:hypothetical protein
MLLRNVGCLSTDCMALYARIHYFRTDVNSPPPSRKENCVTSNPILSPLSGVLNIQFVYTDWTVMPYIRLLRRQKWVCGLTMPSGCSVYRYNAFEEPDVFVSTAVGSSETLIPMYQATWCHITENSFIVNGVKPRILQNVNLLVLLFSWLQYLIRI